MLSKINDFIKFDVANIIMVIRGHNRGCVGVIKNRGEATSEHGKQVKRKLMPHKEKLMQDPGST